MTTATRDQQEVRTAARDRLREEIPAGSELHTILRHVSQSGMTRSISVIQVRKDGGLRDWTHLIATALDMKVDRYDGIKIGGCGMDMGFALVYNLSNTLYGSGSEEGYPCLGDRCPSNSHVNDHKAPRGPGVFHDDGYALSQRWL